MNMFNLGLTVPLVEMSLKYTIREFTILKKLIFPRGGGNSYQLCGWCSLDHDLSHSQFGEVALDPFNQLILLNFMTRQAQFMSVFQYSTKLTQQARNINAAQYSNIGAHNSFHVAVATTYRARRLSVCDTYPNFFKIFSVLSGATLNKIFFLNFCKFLRFTLKNANIMQYYAITIAKIGRVKNFMSITNCKYIKKQYSLKYIYI